MALLAEVVLPGPVGYAHGPNIVVELRRRGPVLLPVGDLLASWTSVAFSLLTLVPAGSLQLLRDRHQRYVPLPAYVTWPLIVRDQRA